MGHRIVWSEPGAGMLLPLFILLAPMLLAGCERQPPSPPPSSTAPALRPYDKDQLARGERIYAAHCGACHGPHGRGTPNWRAPGPDGKYPPPPLDDTAHAWHHPTAVLEKVVREGSPRNLGNMPAWGEKLTSQQIRDVVVYVTSLWSDPVYERWYTQVEHPQPAGEPR